MKLGLRRGWHVCGGDDAKRGVWGMGLRRGWHVCGGDDAERGVWGRRMGG